MFPNSSGKSHSLNFGRSQFMAARVQNMQERELGMKVARQSRGKDRSPSRGLGKVDGRNDSWQRQHLFSLQPGLRPITTAVKIIHRIVNGMQIDIHERSPSFSTYAIY
jgi:hypothetical protein